MSRRQVDIEEGPTHFIYGGDHAVGSFMQVWDERFAGSKFDPQGEGYVLDCDEMFGISLNLIDAHPEDLKNQEKIRGLVNIYILKLESMKNEYEELDKFLESKGWILECYSPLEIQHKETETRANGYAAELIIEQLHNETKKKKK